MFGVWGGGKRERLLALPVVSSPRQKPTRFPPSLSPSLFRKLARFRRGGDVISRRRRRTPPSRAGDTLSFLMLVCGAGRGTRGGTRVAAALRRHAGVQPQRGEDLQSQLRKVSARGEALRGPPPGKAAAVSSALAAVSASSWPVPGSGRPGG